MFVKSGFIFPYTLISCSTNKHKFKKLLEYFAFSVTVKRTLGRKARVEFSKIHYYVQIALSHISLEISLPIQFHAITVTIKQFSARCMENSPFSARVGDFKY